MKNTLSQKIRLVIILLISLLLSLWATKFLFTVGLFSSAEKELNKNIEQGGEPLNPYILQVVNKYSQNYPCQMCAPNETKKKLGVSRDLYYKGEKIADAGSNPCVYCIGLVFDVFISSWEIALKEKNISDIGNLDLNNIKNFRKKFYGVFGNEKTCVDALTEYGLGIEITNIDLAKPGDLVQFWRFNKTGHCVIFNKLTRNNKGETTGINYWSVQKMTNGINYNTEYFGNYSNNIDKTRVFIVRPVIPFH